MRKCEGRRLRRNGITIYIPYHVYGWLETLEDSVVGLLERRHKIVLSGSVCLAEGQEESLLERFFGFSHRFFIHSSSKLSLPSVITIHRG